MPESQQSGDEEQQQEQPAVKPSSGPSSQQAPVSPSIVKSGRKSSPRDERALEERMAAMEDENSTLKDQLSKVQKDLSEFGKTNKGKGFMDSFREFLGWD